MKILVTGSSGLIGSALIPFLKLGQHQIAKLVRKKTGLKSGEIAWDLEKGIINPELLEGVEAVIHLAGENIASIWTEKKKKQILESRVKGTKLLCQNLICLKSPPEVLISSSAIGYYGDHSDQILTEHSPKGQGFLADVCQQWEAATQSATEAGIRTVFLRTGIVLSTQGGALKSMLTPFKLGLGGELGSGKQYMSWISIDDLIGIIYYVIRQKELQGAINAVSPNPVTNREFTKILGNVLHRPTFFKIPTFVLKWIVGEMAEEVLLKSRRVIPEILEDKGFRFDHPNLKEALQSILTS
ncbi:TIGR01777 family oxidoreductase [Candidatus Protochlamydia amoebophila]|nr:TIGR01777 family oxidoreductase [Candidatus Protochlamydia amoebophila]